MRFPKALYPIGPAIARGMGDALAGYEVSKGTIRFPLSSPLPAALVRRLVKAPGARPPPFSYTLRASVSCLSPRSLG